MDLWVYRTLSDLYPLYDLREGRGKRPSGSEDNPGFF